MQCEWHEDQCIDIVEQLLYDFYARVVCILGQIALCCAQCMHCKKPFVSIAEAFLSFAQVCEHMSQALSSLDIGLNTFHDFCDSRLKGVDREPCRKT